MKFVMLRATHKQTEVKYQDQIACNDDFYEDVSTSSDYWTVFASKLLEQGWYDEAEIWYQKDSMHKVSSFVHSTGLREVFWEQEYSNLTSDNVPTVLFVRGNMVQFFPVLEKCRNSFRVYYPSGPYYYPTTDYGWDLCFVEDPRHVAKVEEKTGAHVELFKKSCVGKYFRQEAEKEWDICFVCCAPIYVRKRLLFLRDILKRIPSTSALIIGLTDEKLIREFKGLNVKFTGWLPRTIMSKEMAKCRTGLVLSKSLYDGCPRVIQEFLANGLPIVISDETCCSSIYINRKTGVSASDDKIHEAILDTLAIASLYDVNEFYRTSLSMNCSVRHFVENMKKHGGPTSK